MMSELKSKDKNTTLERKSWNMCEFVLLEKYENVWNSINSRIETTLEKMIQKPWKGLRSKTSHEKPYPSSGYEFDFVRLWCSRERKSNGGPSVADDLLGEPWFWAEIKRRLLVLGDFDSMGVWGKKCAREYLLRNPSAYIKRFVKCVAGYENLLGFIWTENP